MQQQHGVAVHIPDRAALAAGDRVVRVIGEAGDVDAALQTMHNAMRRDS